MKTTFRRPQQQGLLRSISGCAAAPALFSVAVGQANFAAKAGFAKSAARFGRLDDQRPDRMAVEGGVYRDKRKIRAAGVLALPGYHIFAEHLYTHFHRGVEHAVDPRLQNKNVAN